MKTPIAALARALAAAALCANSLYAGSALAQTRPEAPAPRTGVAPPPPAVGTVPAGQTGREAPQSGIGASYDLGGATPRGSASRRASTGEGVTPVNGIGGTGGGRYTVGQTRVINNSETDLARAAPGFVNIDSSNRDHIDQDAQGDIRRGRALPTNLGQTPVNGIGGTGGGRLSNVPPVNDPDDNVAAEGVAPATGTVPAGQGQGQSRRPPRP